MYYLLLVPVGLLTIYGLVKSHRAKAEHEAIHEEARLNRMRLLNRITDEDHRVWH